MATTTYASGALIARPGFIETLFGFLNRYSAPSQDFDAAFFSLRGL
jgi:hypothetical protein